MLLEPFLHFSGFGAGLPLVGLALSVVPEALPTVNVVDVRVVVRAGFVAALSTIRNGRCRSRAASGLKCRPGLKYACAVAGERRADRLAAVS